MNPVIDDKARIESCVMKLLSGDKTPLRVLDSQDTGTEGPNFRESGKNLANLLLRVEHNDPISDEQNDRERSVNVSDFIQGFLASLGKSLQSAVMGLDEKLGPIASKVKTELSNRLNTGSKTEERDYQFKNGLLALADLVN